MVSSGPFSYCYASVMSLFSYAFMRYCFSMFSCFLMQFIDNYFATCLASWISLGKLSLFITGSHVSYMLFKIQKGHTYVLSVLSMVRDGKTVFCGVEPCQKHLISKGHFSV